LDVGQPETVNQHAGVGKQLKLSSFRRSLPYFKRGFLMPDDPNQKQNKGSGSSGRPQSGPESEQDRDQKDQGGQRRAS
jgi:hypothetical protein